MKCNSQASLLAFTFARPCFDREPKARAAIVMVVLSLKIRLMEYILSYPKSIA
jgi:hypothetical protein